MERDIENINDVKTVVNKFYNKVRQDDLLAPIFNGIIANRWPEHLEKMYCFWETILLGNHTYSGYPFHPHAELPVSQHHFDRWLSLFFKTLDENYEGEKVFAAKRQAHKMAYLFQMRIQQIKVGST